MKYVLRNREDGRYAGRYNYTQRTNLYVDINKARVFSTKGAAKQSREYNEARFIVVPVTLTIVNAETVPVS